MRAGTVNERRLEGSVALITGASSGIGEAAARALARRGCSLVLAARRADRLASLAGELGRGPRGVAALPLPLDVTRRESVEEGVGAALERFGHIDVVFNNAGVGSLDWLERLDPQAGVELPIAVNLTGSILVTRQVLPHMLARRRGHLLFMGSLASLLGMPTYSVYAATKFGVRGFSEALRREVSAWGIQVTTIYPGAVRTGFAGDALARRRTRMTTPRRLVLTPEAVGEKVARLVERPRRQVLMPPIAWAAVWANALLPGVIDTLARRFFVLRERPGGPEVVG